MTSSTATLNRQLDNDRFQSAIWYAWGRKDASGESFNEFAFAEHYVSLDRALREGRTSFLPSIQDAFKAWRAAS